MPQARSQVSILGPILFNIFNNDMFLLFVSDLYNFSVDNTITAMAETIQDLVQAIQGKTETALYWMDSNDMIANPEKFKAIVLSKCKQNLGDAVLVFRDQTMSATKTVDLLGITIDNKLSFEKQVSKFCRKAAGQLNALKRLSPYQRSSRSLYFFKF